MARRRNTSAAEDLFDIAAMLPWWVSTLIALVAYLFLHRHATVDIPMTVVPGQMGKVVVEQMTKSLAYYGQYLLPLIFLAGAGASYIGRRKRQSLVSEVAGGGGAIRRMNWQDFEVLVGEAFRLRGYSVIETGGGGPDGGIDLELSKGGEIFLVQCKHWRGFKVSVNVVRELFGVMAARGATGGFVVTSGVFTADAESFAKGRNIELIDGAALKLMIDQARVAASSASSATGKRLANGGSSPPVATPTCPRCGGVMTKRVAKQGANAGGEFWGCANFPRCRGIRPIA